MSDGHDYRETHKGIRYNPEALDELGIIEKKGIRFMYDRMNGELVVERQESIDELRELVEEFRDRADGTSYEYDGAAYRSAANELEEVLDG